MWEFERSGDAEIVLDEIFWNFHFAGNKRKHCFSRKMIYLEYRIKIFFF